MHLTPSRHFLPILQTKPLKASIKGCSEHFDHLVFTQMNVRQIAIFPTDMLLQCQICCAQLGLQKKLHLLGYVHTTGLLRIKKRGEIHRYILKSVSKIQGADFGCGLHNGFSPLENPVWNMHLKSPLFKQILDVVLLYVLADFDTLLP